MLFVLVALGASGTTRTASARGITWAGNDGIYGARTDGTAIRRITDFSRVAPGEFASDGFGSPDWTKSGDRLAYTGRFSGSTFVFVASPREGTARVLGLGDDVWSPSWSPDGGRLAFAQGCCHDSGYGERGSTISIRNVGSGSGRSGSITARKRERFDESPDWSPDGRTIAFVRRTPGGSGIYLVGADGKGLRRLTGGSSPSWSPDSRQLVFSAGGRVLTIGAGGRSRLDLGAGTEPNWSPDGSTILFLHGSPSPSIWVMDSDGTNRTRLVQHNAARGVHDPTWRPA